MNKIFLLAFLVTAIFVSSCKRKQISKSESEIDAVGRLVVQEIDFNYFSSKAKVNYDDGNNKMGLTVNIRMKKDSIIWLSASPALGIEAARAVVTPDSVKIMNRLNNTYQAYSIAYLKQMFNVDLSFANLQNMLIGNLVVPKKKGDRLDSTDVNCNVLIQENNNIKIANRVSRQNNKVTDLQIKEQSSGNQLNVNYQDFKELGKFLFAYQNTINASVNEQGKSQNVEIKIEHNKAEISDQPLNFAFNVPSKYETK